MRDSSDELPGASEREHAREQHHHHALHLDWDWHGLGGPFGSVRRHPFTVVVAGLGAVAATLASVRVAHQHRRGARRAAKRTRLHLPH